MTDSPVQKAEHALRTPAFWKDTAEKAISTFAQTLVVLLFAVNTPLLTDPPWLAATIAGLIAAGVSVLTSIASAPLPPPSNKWLDLAIRTIKTFIQAFVGSLLIIDYVNVNWYGALATALPVAMLAFLKGLIAMNVPGTEPGPGLVPEPAAQPVVIESTDPDWPKPAGHVEL